MFYHHLNADRFHQKYNILDNIFIYQSSAFQAKYIQMSYSFINKTFKNK